MNLEDLKSYSMAGYEEYRPPKREVVIEALWSQFTPLNAPAGGTHYLVPESTVNIALSRRINSRNGTSHEQIDIYGPINRSFTFNLIPGHQLIAARIKPEWLPSLIGISAGDILNAELNLVDVAPELNEKLLGIFEHNLTTAEMVQRLYKSIVTHSRERLTSYHLPDYGLRAIELIRRCSGNLKQSTIARHLEVSERQLRRTVQNLIGLSPKSFSRNIRFLKTLEFADRTQTINWSDCAVCFGYFDQAHLINECKAITNLTPRELMASRKAESVFSNPD